MFFEFFGRRPELRVIATGSRRRFRRWRGERPFWAGLFTSVAGLPIMYFPYAHLHLGGIPLALSTTAGAGSVIIGTLLVVLGMCLWFHQQVRVFAGVAALLLALISFPVANFGGLFFGLLSGLIGGSLACAWTPPTGTAEAPPAVNRASTAVPVSEDQSGK
ncbi:DUF6114 domain-containing protein [Streptomyces albiflavescens]|uniref:DUF6114 domain-containing protein n=1 Tax=Streptomyces albiflavescens TaxID=1623582 RepID=UPI001666F6C5|nr:DUF6114 domain-containing protein [Streptomyces albiflavescens]